LERASRGLLDVFAHEIQLVILVALARVHGCACAGSNLAVALDIHPGRF